MSKRLEVLTAVKALIQAALPGAKVIGMTTDEVKPDVVPALGMAIIRAGDPGPADIDLSPPRYHYDHAITVELASYESPGITSQQALDAMAVRIMARIVADRTLGGLCDWLDAEALTEGTIDTLGARSLGWADLGIVAAYWTPTPLT